MSRQRLKGFAFAATAALLMVTPAGPAAAAAVSPPVEVPAAHPLARMGGTADPALGGPGRAMGGLRHAERLASKAGAALIAAESPALQISPHDDFVPKPVLSSSGLHYAPFERTWRGLRVVGGDFVVVTDAAGTVLDTSVAQEDEVRLASIAPRVSPARAQAVARAELRGADRVASPRLVVWQGRRSHLAWAVRVAARGHGVPSAVVSYVDARAGRVLETRERVLGATGFTAYSGTVGFVTTGQPGPVYTLEHRFVPGLACRAYDTTTAMSKSVNVWGNGDPSSLETGCADAYYAADQTQKMLRSWLRRDGLDGAGGWLPVEVGVPVVNAAYLPGRGVLLGHSLFGNRSLGSLDIVAHEYGHAVDSATPGGDSGTETREFIADVFGAATEAFANNLVDRPDYLIGEQVNMVGGPVRNMFNPAALRNPNCFSDAIPGLTAHQAAGPGDHWFYLLAEGSSPTDGQPTSPTCDGSSLSGVGIQTALKVVYHAMLRKTSNASYARYREWTLAAAANLDPSCRLHAKVAAAWNAVGVAAAASDPAC